MTGQTNYRRIPAHILIINHPQDVKVVERGEIIKQNLPNVEEVLKTMPGVEVYSTAGIGSRISIRGSGKSGGVLVLLNGRPLNTNQHGNLDLNSIPLAGAFRKKVSLKPERDMR